MTEYISRHVLGVTQSSDVVCCRLQERRQAIELRAAAAAAQGAQPISSEEKRALRAAGQATRQAAAAELAAQLKKTDADLQKLTDPEKSAWFEVRWQHQALEVAYVPRRWQPLVWLCTLELPESVMA